MSGRPRFPVALLLASALALGCHEKSKAKQAELEQDRKRVSLDSSHDASAAVVDEGYRFRLDNPGPGWKTLGEADARKINPDALAMAVNAGTFVAVFVEHMPGVELDPYVELLLAADPSVELELREPTRFVGEPGIRLRFSVSVHNVRSTHEARIIARGDYIYRVDAWHTEGGSGPTSFEPVFAAFSLLDGEIVPREAARAPVLDAHGSGWLLDRGTFRSAISGLEITATDSLRMLVGGELHDIDPSAEVGFMRENPTLFVVLEPQPWDTLSLAQSRDLQREQLAGSDKLEPAALELSVLGQPVVLDAWSEGAMRFYSGPFDLGERRMQVLAWWPEALDQRNRPSLVELAAQIRRIDDDARTAVADALLGMPIAEQSIGPGWAIRNGSYRDFGRGITWTAPRSTDAAWVFLTGDDASTWDPDATVVLFDRRSGRYVVLVDVPDVGSLSDADWQQRIADIWPGIAQGRRETIQIAGRTGELVHGEIEEDDGPRPVSLVSLRVGDHGVALLQESPTEVPDRTLHDLLADGFTVHDQLPEIEQRGRRWNDHRMGISLELPSSWTARDQTPEPLTAVSRMTLWSQAGQDKLLLLAIHPPQWGQDLDWAEGFVEQLARDSLGVLAKDVAKRREITIAGLPGRELSWSDPPTTVSMVRNGGTFCMLIGSDAKPAEIAAISSSLEFLE